MIKITHEEAIILVDWVFNNSEIENVKLRPLIDYITQQERESKLLGLYQKREDNRNLPHPSQADEIIYSREIKHLRRN